MLVLSIPVVQTSLGNYATKKLNKEFGTNINIAKVGLQFNGDVELKNIYIKDYKQDTLISVVELNTSLINVTQLVNGKLAFGDIDINDLVFNIKTYKDTTATNLDVFVARFDSDNPRKGKSSFLMSSSDISIYNGVFKLIDENKKTQNLLHFKDININATNFLINGVDVSMRVNTLNFLDSRGLRLKNLATNFSYTLTDMKFLDLDIKTEKSHLKGALHFAYERKDFKNFVDKVRLTANFQDSNLLLDDLNSYYNEFGANQHANFDVDLMGTLNNLAVSNLKLNTSRNSKIYGDIVFKNLFSLEPNTFYMNGRFKNLTSTYNDLTALLPNVLGKTIPSSFSKLGAFVITGQSQITSKKVIADLGINTELGFIDSNLKISKIDDIDNANYNGNIILKAFDLGRFIENPKVGVVSLNLDVNGTGFVPKTLNTQVKGAVYNFNFNNYNYKNIKVAGNVKNNIFDGNLITNDENLKLNFTGLVDFSEKVYKYDFEANIDFANLQVLNFVNKDSISIFKSSVKMNMNSSSYDDAYGKIAFRNTSYKNQNDTYYFDAFDIASRFEGTKRFIDINSPDIIEGSVSGRFIFKDLVKLVENSLGHIYTNYTPHQVKADQTIDFNFKIYNKIIEVIYPEITLGKNTFIKGRLESDEEKFRLTFKSPAIKLKNNFANNIELQVDNGNPLFNTFLEIDSLNTKFYNVSKFSLINVTVNDTLFMRSEFKGGKRNKDSYNLSFYHTINPEKESVVGFKKSDFTVKDHKWLINENQDDFNKVSFNKTLTEFNINKLKINHLNEEVSLSGFVKDSTQKDLKLDFKNVDLSKITPDIDSLSLAGNVNGKLDILQKNGNYLPNSTVVIDDFTVNNFLLGSFDATIIGNKTLTNYNVNASIKNDTSKSFNAVGDITVAGENSNIDVDLIFNNFNLNVLNPLLQDILNNIRGEVTGKTRVIGDLKKPNIKGELSLNNAGLAIPYLNVDYSFSNNASVSLNNQSFNFNKIKLTDIKHKSKGVLNGSLSHVNFGKWSLDLDIETPRLLILDTKQTDESLYFGTGFIGGKASIKGPADELLISVQGETKRGTVFKIPISDTESFGDNSFIHFITPEQKRAKELGEEVVVEQIKGLELYFDLDVTEDAEVEIIVDKNTGHALKGRGVGGLLVEINTNGKFNMWGDFSVFEGVYNFAYGGLVQKEFIVQPGGTVAWDGEPFGARIDMLAVYKTQANPSPLLDNPISRSIPVELNINLNGGLEQLNPNFSFEFPNVNSTIKSELQYRLESEDDKENQALYLLSTGSFSRGLNDLNFSGTIAERLNGIINGIFTNDDGKIDIGLNYEAGENRPDFQSSDRFGVTIKTQISERVIINGKVGVPVGEAGANETVVAGDAEIDFLLNQDGTLTAKVFNRENSIRNFGEAIGYTQGVGLSYNVDFDTFKELIRTIFRKKTLKVIVEKEEENTKTESPLPSFITHKTLEKHKN